MFLRVGSEKKPIFATKIRHNEDKRPIPGKDPLF